MTENPNPAFDLAQGASRSQPVAWRPPPLFPGRNPNDCSPGAAQRVAVRCRPGVHNHKHLDPGQHRTIRFAHAAAHPGYNACALGRVAGNDPMSKRYRRNELSFDARAELRAWLMAVLKGIHRALAGLDARAEALV
jgi:hypothetical protein